ncbi:MAG TPA: putative metal-binding motif-containing protein [Kofleriaceae bacterium]|jgi:hypothetical protein
MSRLIALVFSLGAVVACGPANRNGGGGGGGGGGDGGGGGGCVDNDGDGYTTCDGDCCDDPTQCSNPAVVNPGAYDVPGDGVDNDCDGTIDNAPAACDQGLASNSNAGLDFAKAIELCQTTTMQDKKWGVLSAQLTKADGSALDSGQSVQHSIRPHYGTGTTPKAGSSLIELSTGNAAATADTNPGPDQDEDGEFFASSDFPSDWYAANGSTLPNAPGCPASDPLSQAGDPVMLTLTIRVPTNAQSFTLDVNFFSSEFPEWTCSPYNDFFVVLLDSMFQGTGMTANPADKNIAVYIDSAMKTYPVGVNLASGNTGLFTQCKNGTVGCAPGSTQGSINTCTGTTDLAGTGMELTDPNGGCTGDTELGGGTGWLTTTGNVVPGEIMKLRIAIWDTSDDALDSLAVIDNFQWQATTSTPGTVIQ